MSEPRLPAAVDADAVRIIRGLAMDAPLAAKSGHQGTAMALAPMAHVLWTRILRFDPADPAWADRDRFVLSNGHASILQYALSFLAGQGLEMEDLRAFRQWGSRTPGHPEAGHSPGVEVTTGPLGQGLANAVGMAIAERHLRATLGAAACDHHTWVVAGDGCLMEGISHEAASLAGHLGLERLTVVFDDNGITIDGRTGLACSDDVAGRFGAYGWRVLRAGDGVAEDLDALERILRDARDSDGRPTLLVLPTRVGTPSPDWTDRHEAHGNPFTADHVAATKRAMGMPDEAFWAPPGVVAECRRHAAARAARARRDAPAWPRPDVDAAQRALPSWQDGAGVATRVALAACLDATREAVPGLLAGSADLTGNTGTRVAAAAAHGRGTPEGAQVYYGIREHAMGAAAVGMALHGGVVPVVGTFFVFSDYLRPALRLAALSRARAVFVFSHDSVGVGEDGPTHQPVEHLMSLRLIPGLQVIRPADARETAAAWVAALAHDGPTALVLTRQNVPVCTDGGAVEPGAAAVRRVDGARVRLLATGSEVHVALAAADLLAAEGLAAEVVSMPSWDRASRSGADRALLRGALPTVALEAGVTLGWERWAHAVVGIDRFGASAPGAVAMARLGITPEAVADAARRVVRGSPA
ncbi:MAG: transketolase [Actinomycetota bacterium]